jgi:hypothetical protein
MSRLIFPNNHFFGGNGNLYAIKLIAGLIDKIVFRICKSGIADILQLVTNSAGTIEDTYTCNQLNLFDL